MNINSLTKGRFSAKLFAALTIVSLLVSAVPATFFNFNVAEAAAPDVLFSDSFETEDFSNWIGALVGDAWATVNNAAGAQEGNIRAQVSTTSPTDALLRAGFSTVGYEDIKVSYYYQLDNLEAGESVTLRATPGTIPTGADVVKTYSDGDGDDTSDWTLTEINLSSDMDDKPSVLLQFNAFFTSNEVFKLDNVVVTGTPIAPAGTVRNVEDDLFFATIQEAIDAATTEAGETIELTADISTTEQTSITKAIVLDGNGFTVDGQFVKTSNSNNAVLGITNTDGVTVKDVVLMSSGDQPWPEQLHGINIYESIDITLENVTVKDFEGSGIVVNGSTVDASDITTENNGWHGINVAPGFEVTSPSVLNIANTSTHNEGADIPHIFTDNINAGPSIVVNDIDGQYDYIDIPEVPQLALSTLQVAPSFVQQLTPVARAYFLKETEEPEAPSVCTYEGQVVSHIQGLTNGGGAVDAARGDVAAVEAGVAPYSNFFGSEGSDWEVNPLDFYSMGINGELVYEFDNKIAVDQAGADIAIWEITGGTDATGEMIDVYLSEDGINFELADTLTGDGTVDIADTNLDFVKFVKLVDQSNGVQGSNGDGFDLDAITIIDGSCEEPEVPTQCTVTIKSDDTNTVVEKDGALAVVLDFIHDNWTESLPLAEWIWGDQGPQNPSESETQTFVNQFGWNGDVLTEATLYIAADNNFSASLNDALAGEELGGVNHTATKEYDVTGLIQSGNNELSVVVENFAGNSNPANNPAGLYYELVIEGEGDLCEIPYVPEPEEPDYASYCGDGEVTGWEMCEPGDTDCTDYCTLDNQCTDLRLVKISLDNAPESVSFDGNIYLGDEDNVIPAGTWFNFDEVGDATINSFALDVDGIAVERNGTDLRLAISGGNNGSQFDYAFGNIMTQGIDLGAVDRGPVPGWELEDPEDSSYPDIFDKNGDEGVDFEFYLTTGEDAVAVEVNNGEEYNCPECKATVEARVILNETGNTGNGHLNEQVILGDAAYTTVEFGEWFPVSIIESGETSATMINDPHTVTNFDDPGNKSGLFVSREGGTVKVALYGKHNPGGNTNNEWIDARIEVRDAGITNFSNLSGSFKLENHSETNNVPTDDGSDVATPDYDGVDFRLWVDTQSDGFRFDIHEETIVPCDDDTSDMMLIEGYKFEGDPEYATPLAGWTIELYEDQELITSTTTDDSGYYYFYAPVGDYEVSEVMQLGWYQVGVEYEGEYDFINGEGYESCYLEFDPKQYGSEGLSMDDETPYTCDFYNALSEEPTERIDGYKYLLVDAQEVPEAGWTIYLEDGEGNVIASTSTDDTGYYYFDVLLGDDYVVVEAMPAGYEQVEVRQNLQVLTGDTDSMSCEFYIEDESIFTTIGNSLSALIVIDEPIYEGNRCDFVNQVVEEEPEEPEEPEEETSSGGSSSGTRTRTTEPAPEGIVLGASTVNQCPFIIDFMQVGWENDRWEVTKLQMFLSIVMGYDVAVTGEFDAATDAAVKQFQLNYSDEILVPWFEKGIVPHSDPTGFVYKTTRWKINDIVCPGSEEYPDFEGEDLDSNVDID
tara:strand:+ start:3236 stop:7891 length:4656 start_codon:yes stop_codon:yes gene_type:complete